MCVVTIIFVVSAIFPGGTKVGPFTIYLPDYRTWLKSDAVTYKDIQAIIASVDTVDHPFDSVLPVGNDSLPASIHHAAIQSDTLQRVSVDEISTNIYPFEFPEKQDTILFPMFRIINNIRLRNKPVRILHYGDSQIEGDRITATIRNYMQKKYGGKGIGFLPIVPTNDYSVTFQRDVSPHWVRFSILDRGGDAQAANNRYGISGNLARYSPSGTEDTVAYIGLQHFFTMYHNARTFTHARLFYGQSKNPFNVIINQSSTQQMIALNTVSSAWWKFEAPQNSLDLLLVSADLPDLYGITLDGERGVAVDNLPLRGSSGLDFSRMDTAQIGQMFRMVDVEMLILQFGANIVPNIVDNYAYYTRRFAKELRLLKALKPGLTIIVVGVNDISQNSPDGYKSYPNIVKIRDAQKKAAFETGCVFWDLYEAMGGDNSMPVWVFADPPLAQKDFTHFSVGGAKIVAELFCKAWEKEFQKFKNNF